MDRLAGVDAADLRVTADRLLAAEQHTQEHYKAKRRKQWQRWREADPDRLAVIEEMGQRLREQPPER